MNYSFVLNLVVLATNLLMMVSVGLSLETGHFLALRRIKFRVLGLLSAQTLLLPAIGLLVVSVLSLPPSVNAGILLLAACPVGDIANFYVLMAEADTALSVTLNVSSCVLAVVTMPASFFLYRFMGNAIDFPVPSLRLVGQLTLLTLLPLMVGMTVRWLRPEAAQRLLIPLRIVCIIGIVFLILAVSVVEHERLAANWQVTLMGVGLLLGAATSAGLAITSLLRLPRRQLIGGSIIFPVRNIGLALAITVSLLGRVEYAVFALVFFLVEVPLLLSLVGIYRRLYGRSKATNLESSTRPTEGRNGVLLEPIE